MINSGGMALQLKEDTFNKTVNFLERAKGCINLRDPSLYGGEKTEDYHTSRFLADMGYVKIEPCASGRKSRNFYYKITLTPKGEEVLNDLK
jgi:hypothetical protein